MRVLCPVAAVMLALICGLAVFPMTVMADGYYSSNENGSNEAGEPIGQISISTEYIPAPDTSSHETGVEWEVNAEEIDGVLSGFLSLLNSGSGPLTPNGNMTLVDDILQDESFYTVQDQKILKDKQFITVQTKNGNYFYIIVDRSGDTENVYFLNLVDETDLFSLLEDGKDASSVCTCRTRCAAGEVDTDCPVCRYNYKNCDGKPAETKDTEKAPETRDNTLTNEEPKTDTSKKSSPSVLIIVVIVIVIAGGAALYWFKFRKKNPDVKGNTDIEDYDFGEDDEPEQEDENTDDENKGDD